MCFIIVLLEKNGFLIGWKISIHVIGPLSSRILSTVTVVSIDKIFITPSRADKFYRKRKEYKNRIDSHAYISSWTYQPKRYRLFLVSNKYWDINLLTLDIFRFCFKIITCTYKLILAMFSVYEYSNIFRHSRNCFFWKSTLELTLV